MRCDAQHGEEAPFITSIDNVSLEMLRLARVGAGAGAGPTRAGELVGRAGLEPATKGL